MAGWDTAGCWPGTEGEADGGGSAPSGRTPRRARGRRERVPPRQCSLRTVGPRRRFTGPRFRTMGCTRTRPRHVASRWAVSQLTIVLVTLHDSCSGPVSLPVRTLQVTRGRFLLTTALLVVRRRASLRNTSARATLNLSYHLGCPSLQCEHGYYMLGGPLRSWPALNLGLFCLISSVF